MILEVEDAMYKTIQAQEGGYLVPFIHRGESQARSCFDFFSIYGCSSRTFVKCQPVSASSAGARIDNAHISWS